MPPNGKDGGCRAAARAVRGRGSAPWIAVGSRDRIAIGEPGSRPTHAWDAPDAGLGGAAAV
eukprot:5918069-Prymnesium_polylepis.2